MLSVKFLINHAHIIFCACFLILLVVFFLMDIDTQPIEMALLTPLKDVPFGWIVALVFWGICFGGKK